MRSVPPPCALPSGDHCRCAWYWLCNVAGADGKVGMAHVFVSGAAPRPPAGVASAPGPWLGWREERLLWWELPPAPACTPPRWQGHVHHFR